MRVIRRARKGVTPSNSSPRWGDLQESARERRVRSKLRAESRWARKSYRIRGVRVSEYNTALRFPIKPPSVYTQSVANTLQLSYKRINCDGEESLYSGPIIRGGVHERNRGEVPRGDWAGEERRRDQGTEPVRVY